MAIQFFAKAVTMYGTSFTSAYIFWKSVNHTPTSRVKAITVLWCCIWAFLDALNIALLPFVISRSIFCAGTIILLWKMKKSKFETVVSAYLLSFGVSYSLFYIAGLIIGFGFIPYLGLGLPEDFLIDFKKPIYLLIYVLIFLLQFYVAKSFFKIRRFKNGFPFLFERYTVVLSLIVTGIILTIITLVSAQREKYGTYALGFPLVAAAIIIGAGIIIWIKRSLKMFQKKWASEDNERLLQQEMAELKEKLRKSDEVNETLRTANHNINHRLSAMERSVTVLLEKGKHCLSAEFSEELNIAIANIRSLTREYTTDVDRVKKEFKLPSTHIRTLDELFSLFAERFASNNIRFKLVVNGSIVYMTESIIELGKLETMVGDLLQNALVAIQSSDHNSHCVLAVIGETGDYYELFVHDSGIPFEVDTLVRLGKESATTHADEGGSGIGYMKIIDTIRECGASLNIHENRKGGTFSKSVSIRFDNENRTIIETYRAGDFPYIDGLIVKDIRERSYTR